MQGVDLEQAAKLFWLPDGQTTELTERQFKRLRDAINFAFTALSDSERQTAKALFDGDPGTLDFSDPETEKRAKGTL